jgi:hypothetical protein
MLDGHALEHDIEQDSRQYQKAVKPTIFKQFATYDNKNKIIIIITMTSITRRSFGNVLNYFNYIITQYSVDS